MGAALGAPKSDWFPPLSSSLQSLSLESSSSTPEAAVAPNRNEPDVCAGAETDVGATTGVGAGAAGGGTGVDTTGDGAIEPVGATVTGAGGGVVISTGADIVTGVGEGTLSGTGVGAGVKTAAGAGLGGSTGATGGGKVGFGVGSETGAGVLLPPKSDEADVEDGVDEATDFVLSSIESSSMEKFAINALGNPAGAYEYCSAGASYFGAYGSSSSIW